MRPVKEYGFRSGGRVADWACEVCQKIVYPQTPIQDIPRARLDDICVDCRAALNKAHDLAEEWWWAEDRRVKAAEGPNARPDYFSRTSSEKGMYALRDDLADHLTGRGTSDRLKRFAKKLGKALPVA